MSNRFGLLHIPSGTIIMESFGNLYLKTYKNHLLRMDTIGETAWKYWDLVVQDRLGFNILMHRFMEEEFEIVSLPNEDLRIDLGQTIL